MLVYFGLIQIGCLAFSRRFRVQAHKRSSQRAWEAEWANKVVVMLEDKGDTSQDFIRKPWEETGRIPVRMFPVLGVQICAQVTFLALLQLFHNWKTMLLI